MNEINNNIIIKYVLSLIPSKIFMSHSPRSSIILNYFQTNEIPLTIFENNKIKQKTSQVNHLKM